MVNKQFCSLALCLLLTVLQAAKAQTRPSCPGSNLAPVLGVATHFGFKDATLGNMALIREAGFKSLRDEVFWRHVENDSGLLRIPQAAERYVNSALQNGVQPILVLGYGHDRYDQGDKPLSPAARAAWTRYAAFVVAHFKGRVNTFELWNEWDHTLGKTRAGQPSDYVRLIQEAAPALRRANPEACLIAGAATSQALRNGWLQSAIELGLLHQVDALSIHSYNFTEKEPNARTPEAWHAETTALEEKVNSWTGQGAFSNKALYVTEMGWPNHYGRFGISESLQAAYAARTFLLARSIPWLHGLWWYGWQDKGRHLFNSEHHYGVVDANGTAKMTWTVLAEQNRLLSEGRFTGHKYLAPAQWVTKPVRYHALQFEHVSLPAKPKQHTLALWRTQAPDFSQTEARIVLQARALSTQSSVHFSSSCQVRAHSKLPNAWLLTLHETPCLAQIEGEWL